MTEVSYTIEDGREHILEKVYDRKEAIHFAETNLKAKAVFAFDKEDELLGCIWSRQHGEQRKYK